MVKFTSTLHKYYFRTEASIKSNRDDNTTESVVGPLRVIPGKLSVSRTIGDVEAKVTKYGGNPNVIIGIPEIKYFDINPSYDFIFIGCIYQYIYLYFSFIIIFRRWNVR